jgi:hypothetical protein
MQKIIDLLKKLTASPELVKEITEGLGTYKTELKAQYDAELKDRATAARNVCIEAVEKEKKEMARKVEIFLESRLNTITREAQKQAAIGETRANKTLRELHALLEGVKIDGNAEDHQAAVAERNKLRVFNKRLSEALEKANLKATRANTIAMRLLKRQQLESKSPKTPMVVAEATIKPVAAKTLQSLKKPKTTPQTTQIIAEATAKPKSVLTEAADPEVQKIAEQVDVIA